MNEQTFQDIQKEPEICLPLKALKPQQSQTADNSPNRMQIEDQSEGLEKLSRMQNQFNSRFKVKDYTI